MRTLKNYNTFIFENATEMIEIFNDADILESIVTDETSLLKSINAEEVDLYQSFNLNPDDMKTKFTIEELYNNNSFNKCLNKLKLKKNELESTDDAETFIDNTIQIVFFSIFKSDVSELEKPEYIIFQSKKRNDKEWNSVKCYKVNEDMRKFYDKLTNKTVEIRKGDKTYIYNTSDSGNDWQLAPTTKEENKFKKIMSNDYIKDVLLDGDVSITIIS